MINLISEICQTKAVLLFFTGNVTADNYFFYQEMLSTLEPRLDVHFWPRGITSSRNFHSRSWGNTGRTLDALLTARNI